MDKDKILQALTICEGHDFACDITNPKCPYFREEDKHANYGFPRCFNDMKKDVIALLKEQEIKTGHWLESAGDDRCSVCGATYSDLYPDYNKTHFCPNCGAKMV